MKKNYHLDDFEAFLSDSADQHRMYPSDRVWRNIDKELHGQKKWPALTFGALLTGAIITAGLILVHPDKNLLQIDPQQQVAPQHNSATTSSDHLSASAPSVNGKQNRDFVEAAGAETNTASANAGTNTGYYDFSEAGIEQHTAHQGNSVTIDVTDQIAMLPENNFVQDALMPLSGVQQTTLNQAYPNAGTGTAAAIVEADEISVTNMATENQVKSLADLNAENSNEQVPQLSADKKKNRWAMEYYFTPSYSYRYLTESKITDLHQSQQTGPIAPNLINPVNNFVSHKPTVGLEVGAGIAYQASSKLQVKAGLQFNMRGYSIDAYAASVEPSTIVLNRGYFTDSIFALSSYSNQSGYKAVTIENRYWQVAIPIGISYQVTNGKKINLSVAASLQPTYQFNNSEYILSHDYQNYVQEPSLIRQFNLNAAIGAVISYQTAGATWQVGPQIRYQAMSGTVTEYPIREHLLDYGFRIGVVKTLK
jgi:hypothetical protein